jgi:hypothetical protein
MNFDELFAGFAEEIERKIVNGIQASDFIPYQASIRVTVRDLTRFGWGN